ncbi:MAG: ABC transporter ATP-binding protein [Variovorax sp.]
MSDLVIEGLCKDYGSTRVLQNIDLTVERGEFVVFVGPSGCGKSTLLRMICGLDEVSAGTIIINGEIVNDVPPSKRGIAMVFQSYALYPHMSVAENLGYALKLAKTPADEIDRRVKKAAEVLMISDYLARKPRQLSGGQRQRVAIGRAIVREPSIFLFDEPLSNLDASLRVDMRMEFARLKERLGTTMIYVTHDQVEAMTLADKIVVMQAGVIEQVGSPIDLYNHPVNRFVAGFIGSPKMNFLASRSDGDGWTLPGNGRLHGRGGGANASIAEIGVRPEHLRLVAGGDSKGDGFVSGVVAATEHLGSDTLVHVDVPDQPRPVLVRLQGEQRVPHGSAMTVHFDLSFACGFDSNGRRVDLADRAGSAKPQSAGR